jgi:hypothetical protein
VEVTPAGGPGGEGAPEAAPAEPAKEPAKEAAAAEQAKEPAKEGKESKEASKAARDPMMGTWLERYPRQDMALVLLSGGQYIRVEQGAEGAQGAAAAVVQRGTWKKEGAAEYSFTPETAPAGVTGEAPAAPAGAAASGRPGPAGQAAAQARPEAGPAGQTGAQPRPDMGPWKITVISLSGRSATVQAGDRVLVLARP